MQQAAEALGASDRYDRQVTAGNQRRCSQCDSACARAHERAKNSHSRAAFYRDGRKPGRTGEHVTPVLYTPRACDCRGPSRNGMGARGRWVAAPLVRRRGSNLPKAPVLAAAAMAPAALSCRRAQGPRSGTSRYAHCRCGRTWPPTRCRTMIPRLCASACTLNTRSAIDRVIGLGKIPTQRLQQAFSQRGRDQPASRRVLVWCHWLWFAFPHAAVAYVALRAPRIGRRGGRADVRGV